MDIAVASSVVLAAKFAEYVGAKAPVASVSRAPAPAPWTGATAPVHDHIGCGARAVIAYCGSTSNTAT
ncbi:MULTISPECIES: hypothetical protein [Lysobacter]|uniref:hypothetical protein n=1 Tax=Lysobacter TaxID=68 RepID=UPI001AF6429D|nr:hypothetical protein [Lysobacter enzymogenes]QQQ00099.1 hypothetical protein JHW41_18595 [Lysobacter enzymogenes]